MYVKDITKYCKRLNKSIKYVHDHKTSIRIPKLACNSLRITTCSDAAFASNADLYSQLRRIVLLTDDNLNSIPVSYKSHKSRRVAHYVLSTEQIAFVDLFDDALSVHRKLEYFLRQSISVHA